MRDQTKSRDVVIYDASASFHGDTPPGNAALCLRHLRPTIRTWVWGALATLDVKARDGHHPPGKTCDVCIVETSANVTLGVPRSDR